MKVTIAHPTVTTRTCPECNGKTLRLSLCGVCGALKFGMTDEQVDRALEVLNDPHGSLRRANGRLSVMHGG